jgi:hypothetical protein
MRWLFIPVLILLWCFPAEGQHGIISGNFLNVGNLPSKSVATLPPCNAGQNGAIQNVTNALTPIVGSTVVTGGAVTTLVHCNGTNWIVG